MAHQAPLWPIPSIPDGGLQRGRRQVGGRGAIRVGGETGESDKSSSCPLSQLSRPGAQAARSWGPTTVSPAKPHHSGAPGDLLRRDLV